MLADFENLRRQAILLDFSVSVQFIGSMKAELIWSTLSNATFVLPMLVIVMTYCRCIVHEKVDLLLPLICLMKVTHMHFLLFQ